jgi:hypothetical protein
MSSLTTKLSTAAAIQSHLHSELAWLRVSLNVHARRLQRQGILPGASAEDAGVAVSGEEAFQRMRSSQRQLFSRPLDLTEEEQVALQGAERHRADTLRALEGHRLPLQRLVRRFRLPDDAYLLLLLCVANEIDPDFPRIFAFLNNHIDRQYPTLSMAMDCLLPQAQGAFTAQQLLDPHAPLLRYRLLELGEDASAKTWPQRPLLISRRVLRYITGGTGLDPDLCAFAELTSVDQRPDEVALSPRDEEPMRRLRAMITAHRKAPFLMPLIALRGPDGVGRRRWAEVAAAQAGRALLSIDLTALAMAYGGIESGLAVALREARLQRAMLCLSGWESLLRVASPMADPEDAPADNPIHNAELLSLQLERALDSQRCFVALRLDPTTDTFPKLRRGLELIDISLPAVPVAAELWSRALSTCPHDGIAPLDFARDFKLTPGQIYAAIEASTSHARFAVSPEPLTALALNKTIKTQIRHRLGDNATFVPSKYSWDDLIVTPDVILQLRELISRVIHRHKVLQEWRFEQRFGAEVGVSALFEGPPGTGKTMGASIIAGELKMDLFQIDLSQVVSKYIGETEKHLAKLFDEAERAQAVLLFDEADSLFSKRTSVKSSNDRYANLKVNYLLQRIERFSGIAILTTNFPESLDSAFSRRLSVRVRFEDPGPAERYRLWQTMLGDREILDDVDITTLSEHFEMTGALIRNAVLRGAFMAAARNQRIDTDILYLASRIELKQQGKLVQGDPIDDLMQQDDASSYGGR